MKKLALFFLISFSCALQGMENTEKETNKNFKYVICCVKEAPSTWREISRKMIPFEVTERKEPLIIPSAPSSDRQDEMSAYMINEDMRIVTIHEMVGIYKVPVKERDSLEDKTLNIYTKSMPSCIFESEATFQFQQMLEDAKATEENLNNSTLFDDID